MPPQPMPIERPWRPVHAAMARTLADARRQLHHASQFGAALGISYLSHQADDSHTNLGWDASLGALRSRAATGAHGAVSVAIRVVDLALLVRRDGATITTIPLDGVAITAATESLRAVKSNRRIFS